MQENPMPADVYRYEFAELIPAEEIETTLVISILAVEALHGESQTMLDAGHAIDAKKRSVVIDAGTEVGRDLNRIFIGFLTREFGHGSFRVARVTEARQPEPMTAQPIRDRVTQDNLPLGPEPSGVRAEEPLCRRHSSPANRPSTTRCNRLTGTTSANSSFGISESTHNKFESPARGQPN